MNFNSMHFLFFFPLVVFIYFVVPKKAKWIWLLITSYYFYMSWNPTYSILMAFSTVVTYLSGFFIDKLNKSTRSDLSKKRTRKAVVAFSFCINLAILFFFKYFDFFVNNIISGFSNFGILLEKPSFSVLLPVGISFYTFQALSYTMDVYRGEIAAERNLARYALFVSFFPQLVAGPIERSKNLLLQIHEDHKFDYNNMKNGLLKMLWGFFLKLVIADRAAILVNQVYNNVGSYTGFEVVIATVFFAIQIYCDFAGYTDIAIGAAQVMGFSLMKNFAQPYFATSIRDFWRRWHISLSTWFRDYLYIPMGGNRCSKLRNYFNIMVTFLVSGLWHGASWNFVIWGCIHGLYQIIGIVTKPFKSALSDRVGIKSNSFSSRFIKTVITFVLVNFAWIFFRAKTLPDAIITIKQMFSSFNPWILFNGTLYKMGLAVEEFNTLIVSCLILLFVSIIHENNLSIRSFVIKQDLWFRWMLYFAAIASILLFGIYGNDYVQTQFIYFQF